MRTTDNIDTAVASRHPTCSLPSSYMSVMVKRASSRVISISSYSPTPTPSISPSDSVSNVLEPLYLTSAPFTPCPAVATPAKCTKIVIVNANATTATKQSKGVKGITTQTQSIDTNPTLPSPAKRRRIVESQSYNPDVQSYNPDVQSYNPDVSSATGIEDGKDDIEVKPVFLDTAKTPPVTPTKPKLKPKAKAEFTGAGGGVKVVAAVEVEAEVESKLTPKTGSPGGSKGRLAASAKQAIAEEMVVAGAGVLDVAGLAAKVGWSWSWADSVGQRLIVDWSECYAGQVADLG